LWAQTPTPDHQRKRSQSEAWRGRPSCAGRTDFSRDAFTGLQRRVLARSRRLRCWCHVSEGEAIKELEAAEKSALIAQVDFFKGCTQREIDDVAKLLVDRHFAIGDELCRQGDAETHGFVLVDGEAAVVVDGEQVATASAGDVVGELSMLGTGRRTATLRALTPVHALLIEPDEIDSVLSADPSSSRRLGRHEHDA
jgi:CRP-like cAMP-binding protein